MFQGIAVRRCTGRSERGPRVVRAALRSRPSSAPSRRGKRQYLPVAYDEELARRIRELVADEPALTEKKMFGGLAFLVAGNMAVAASGQGGLLVRVDPAESETLVATGARL